MQLRRINLGVVFVLCIGYVFATVECPPISFDPNDYLDDPNILQNGLFECGDPNNLTPYGTEANFEPPLYWQRVPTPESLQDCYVALHSSFNPSIQSPHTPATWEITGPFSGNNFVLLSNMDTLPGNYISVKSCKILQQVSLNEGDTIVGAYFFGTLDHDQWNDFASIWLQRVDTTSTPLQIDLAGCDKDEVGSYGSTHNLSPSTNGWISFSHTIESNETGSYYLSCLVEDEEDSVVDSYLAVDGLRICRGGKPLGDINYDCKVDLADYSIISEAWLSFCPDPSVDDPNFPFNPEDYPEPADPNIMGLCLLADLDNNWFVEPNDLEIMYNEWLIEQPSQ